MYWICSSCYDYIVRGLCVGLWFTFQFSFPLTLWCKFRHNVGLGWEGCFTFSFVTPSQLNSILLINLSPISLSLTLIWKQLVPKSNILIKISHLNFVLMIWERGTEEGPRVLVSILWTNINNKFSFISTFLETCKFMDVILKLAHFRILLQWKQIE